MKRKVVIIASVIVLIGAGFALRASLGYRADRLVVKPKTIQDYFDSAYNDNMISAGFTNTLSAKTFKTNQVRKQWRDRGFDYLTEDEMTHFLSDNDFILGESSRYLKNVPKDAGNAIIHNIMKVKHDALVYTITLTHDDKSYNLSDNDVLVKGQDVSWRQDMNNVDGVVASEAMKRLSIPNSSFWELHYSKEIPVYVIGGANDFDRDGLHIIDGILKAIPPKDPIAVVKVEGGYVEIAQW